MRRSNPDAKYARICLGLLLLCALGVFMPGMLGMEMMKWGYGIAFINFFLTLAAGAAALIFFSRAKEWAKIASGENCLAHWQYDQGLWREFLGQDELIERRDKSDLLRLIGWVMLVEGIIFLLLFRDFGSQAVVLVFAALWLVLAFLATVMPGRRRNSRLAGPAEVFISKRGLILGNELHTWAVWGNRFEGVNLSDEQPRYLEFVYSAPGRFTRLYTSVRVPVPNQKDEEARQIAEKVRK